MIGQPNDDSFVIEGRQAGTRARCCVCWVAQPRPRIADVDRRGVERL